LVVELRYHRHGGGVRRSVTLGLCSIAIMIGIYRRVVLAIAVDHQNSWSRSFTDRQTVCLQYHAAGCLQDPGNVMPAFTAYSRLQQENDSRREWETGETWPA